MNDEYLQQQCDEMNAALRASNRAQIESRIQLQHQAMHCCRIFFGAVAVLFISSSVLFEFSIFTRLSGSRFTPLLVLAYCAVFIVFTWFDILLATFFVLWSACTDSIIEDRIFQLEVEHDLYSDDPFDRKFAFEYQAREKIGGVSL